MHVRKVSALILGFNPFAPLAPVFDQLVMGLHQGLDAINVVTHNYGWSLVLLAILVRGVVFLPLNAMQFKSMSRMQELQPKIKALQAKYKSKDSETAQKLNAEVMALYKEHNVNPLAGCLPLVLQMPILIALYYAIIKDNDKFAGATWLWIGSPLSHQFPQILATNLAQSDLVLLALYIVSMYFSVRFASPATDPAQAQQQKIMAFVSPALIGYIGLRYHWPSALIIYWFTFNAVAMTQQYFLLRGRRNNSAAFAVAEQPAPPNRNGKGRPPGPPAAPGSPFEKPRTQSSAGTRRRRRSRR